MQTHTCAHIYIYIFQRASKRGSRLLLTIKEGKKLSQKKHVRSHICTRLLIDETGDPKMAYKHPKQFIKPMKGHLKKFCPVLRHKDGGRQ